MTQEVLTLAPGVKLDANKIHLADGDYVANDGCWIEIQGFAVRIIPSGDGVSINVYQSGREMEDSIAETWATFGMLQTDEDEGEGENKRLTQKLKEADAVNVRLSRQVACYTAEVRRLRTAIATSKSITDEELERSDAWEKSLTV